MIIIKLKGGLGNQLFQYAFGRRIALLSGLPIKLDIISGFLGDFYNRSYILSHFNIIENILSSDEMKYVKISQSQSLIGKSVRLFSSILPFVNFQTIQERFNYQYDEKLVIKYKSAYFEGYWQNERYFKPIEEQIRKEFILKDSLNAQNLNLSNQIRNSNSVSIHFRRLFAESNGNVRLSALSKYPILTLDYYYRSFEILTSRYKDLHFFIFSDDPSWVKRNLILKYPATYIEHSDNAREYEDFFLMSLCKHQIIANSTFSWWAAWLNNNPHKIVIAPLNWVNEPNYNSSDLIPESWIKI